LLSNKLFKLKIGKSIKRGIMVSFTEIAKDGGVFKKIAFSILLLVGMIGAAASIIYQSTGNIRLAVTRAMSIVAHIEIPQSQGAFWLFILSVGGAVVSIYIVLILIDILYSGKLFKAAQEGKHLKQLHNMKNHAIICGGGSLGTSVARRLNKSKKKDVVVIESDNERVRELTHEGLLAVEGDCFDKTYLAAMGVRRARVLVACLNDDGDNLLVTLLAKELNPKIKIIAEATFEKYVTQMQKAGADVVIVPRDIGGKYMADVAVEI
jgi:voltage-gated potassium channel